MIILEGIDGVGKTTVADFLSKKGYTTHHFLFDEKNQDIVEKYLRLLERNTDKMILDRCFISELVYGPILRKQCKLSKKQLFNLLNRYRKINPLVVYLKANKEDILKRRKDDIADYSMLSENFDVLNKRYDKVFSVISRYLDVIELNTSEINIEKMFLLLEDKINENNICR